MASDVDQAEFEAFVQAIRPWLRGEAYAICGDWHEADDLVQVALCLVYQHWDRLERRTELGAYSRRIVLRSFLSERRRSRWRHEVATAVGIDAATRASDTAVDDRQMLLPALRRLGPRQRAVVVLRFLGDFSVEQTARALGCTTATVTSQTVRALDALRRNLRS
ncbi:SigE family RNA polymerase sigma factor [Phytohabitans aurantiacus]|uniref:RNA polymerase sigma24 factor n=1 Tax=Phytohabitans aurantiacus TaxID=3016789 RepID=A0ABQ5R9S9_9ACTN|nr:SigE family RNA polymerase sigma factor [Phytohabitans aurantiacus]GLI03356.1 RNA polymerase sigma24 factor [Phytohabitans aurantiacus]